MHHLFVHVWDRKSQKGLLVLLLFNNKESRVEQFAYLFSLGRHTTNLIDLSW